MTYIKISDPNIIDLAAWQNVISVVNQHSETLSAIINNFGINTIGSINYQADDFIHTYDSGSQKLLYGRVSNPIKSDGSSNSDSFFVRGSGWYYYGSISFVNSNSGTTSFADTPLVVATVNGINTSPISGGVVEPSSRDGDIIVSVMNVNQSGFDYKVMRAGSTQANPKPLDAGRTTYIQWMAIGPKA